jgi:hypothetical protein
MNAILVQNLVESSLKVNTLELVVKKVRIDLLYLLYILMTFYINDLFFYRSKSVGYTSPLKLGNEL